MESDHFNVNTHLDRVRRQDHRERRENPGKHLAPPQAIGQDCPVNHIVLGGFAHPGHDVRLQLRPHQPKISRETAEKQPRNGRKTAENQWKIAPAGLLRTRTRRYTAASRSLKSPESQSFEHEIHHFQRKVDHILVEIDHILVENDHLLVKNDHLLVKNDHILVENDHLLVQNAPEIDSAP